MSIDDTAPDKAVFELGRLHARVEGLEQRQNNTDNVLSRMDGKLDGIQQSLDRAVGGREKLASLVKYAASLFAILATLGSMIVGALHYITIGIAK